MSEIADYQQHLEQDFMFVGVVYRTRLADQVPRVFRNPVASDSQAYAQIMMFVPRRRLILSRYTGQPPQGNMGGVPGDPLPLPGPDEPSPLPSDPLYLVTVRQAGAYHAQHWDLLNQSWALQLCPASASSIPEILSTQPAINNVPDYRLPNLRGVDEFDLQWLSHH